MSGALLFVLITALLGLAYAGWIQARLRAGNDSTVAADASLRAAAASYFGRQSATVGLAGTLAFLLLLFVSGVLTSLGFAIGALCAMGAFYAIWHGNVQDARPGAADPRRRIALGRMHAAGAIALGLLGLTAFYAILALMTPTGREVDVRPLAGFAAGLLHVTVFVRLGGGLFARSALLTAQDATGAAAPGNGGAAADLAALGRTAGAYAGSVMEMATMFMLSLVGAMLVGATVFADSVLAVEYPLSLAGVALLTFLAGEALVRRPALPAAESVFRPLFTTIGLLLIALYLLRFAFDEGALPAAAGEAEPALLLFAAALAGLGLAVLVLLWVLAGEALRRSGRMAAPAAWQRTSGHILLVSALCAGLWLAHALAGDYGLASAVLALQALVAPLIVLAAGAEGFAPDLAAGANAEDPDAAHLQGLVQTTVRSFALVGGMLVSLVLFIALVRVVEARGTNLAIGDARLLAGLIFGGLLNYLYNASTRESVPRNAARAAQDIQRQGESQASSAVVAEALLRRSLAALVRPVLLPMLAVLGIALALGPEALAGAVLGSLLSGLFGVVVLREVRHGAGRRHSDTSERLPGPDALAAGVVTAVAAVALTALLLALA